MRNELLAILDTGLDTSTLLEQIQRLADRQGRYVYAELLGILTSLDLGEHEALVHWQAVVANWRELEAKQGRAIGLATAICDHFGSSQRLLKIPKIVDSQVYEETLREAYFDKLTGLHNRRYIDGILERELALAKRHGNELSLLFFDIDNFKEINDTHGHAVGDLYLQLVADVISSTKRKEDIACRYGGEELLLILPSTGGGEALMLGRRVLAGVEHTPLDHQSNRVSTTLSAGLATYPGNGETAAELLEGCDAALYRAKGAGKNTIATSGSDQRRCLRVGLSLPILVRGLGFEGDQAITAQGLDISLGGFRFQTDASLDKGARIEVLIPLLEEEPLLLIGEVVRLIESPQGSEVGAEHCFKRMDKLSQRAISLLIAERTGEANPPLGVHWADK